MSGTNDDAIIEKSNNISNDDGIEFVTKPPRPRQCGLCNGFGHNSRICPTLSGSHVVFPSSVIDKNRRMRKRQRLPRNLRKRR